MIGEFMQFNFAYKLKKSDIISVLVMTVTLVAIFLINGIDYEPGIAPDCEVCRQDIGPMVRAGHYEEMLWNGAQHVYNSANDNLIQFTRANDLRPAQSGEAIKNCID